MFGKAEKEFPLLESFFELGPSDCWNMIGRYVRAFKVEPTLRVTTHPLVHR
jgi:hypothetical protein